MLSIEKCRKILNKYGENYSDEEIANIRQILHDWIEIEYFSKVIQPTIDEDSRHHVPGIKRRTG
jgi:hypothetical protein